jgi:hypothetical protein
MWQPELQWSIGADQTEASECIAEEERCYAGDATERDGQCCEGAWGIYFVTVPSF